MCTLLVDLVASQQNNSSVTHMETKSSRERSCVAVALNLAMVPVTILAHSLLRRLVSHIGWDLLSSGLTSGSVGRSFQQGTANLFRIATLQRRVAQFRSRERHVPH